MTRLFFLLERPQQAVFRKHASHQNLHPTDLMCSFCYLLSWIYPSTLWRSFPNIPHALKFKTHFSPVLRDYRWFKSGIHTHWSNIAFLRISDFTCGWLSPPFHIVQSRVFPKWCYAHSTLDLSTCMLLYVCQNNSIRDSFTHPRKIQKLTFELIMQLRPEALILGSDIFAKARWTE